MLIRPFSRSQSSTGHKTKWHLRMEHTRREHAVKKLETELKHEKQTEKQRWVPPIEYYVHYIRLVSGKGR